jgi:hypothetical protein
LGYAQGMGVPEYIGKRKLEFSYDRDLCALPRHSA